MPEHAMYQVILLTGIAPKILTYKLILIDLKTFNKSYISV